LRACGLVLLALALGAGLAAQEAPLPPEVQAALLEKVFLFDPALGAGSTVLVVFADTASEGAAQRLVGAFRATEVPAESATVDAAGARLPAVGVVYFLDSAAGDEGLRRLCVEQRRLSVAGTTALAEQGRVAIAVGLSAAGTPEIVIHRARLEQEGHRLEPRVLKLARLVG
jgi:hypothetical protein